jgi:hypothetical protein
MMKNKSLIPVERIEGRIFLIRGHKVMLSNDLAELYEVEPRILVQAVKRNIVRFPEDFMFQLSQEEFSILKSQIVISSWGVAKGCTICFYRTGCRYAIERTPEQTCHSG